MSDLFANMPPAISYRIPAWARCRRALAVRLAVLTPHTAAEVEARLVGLSEDEIRSYLELPGAAALGALDLAAARRAGITREELDAAERLVAETPEQTGGGLHDVDLGPIA